MSLSRKTRTAAVDASLRRLEARHRAALVAVATIGLVLRGSITRRSTRCGNPACRCHADPPMLHGPYNI